MGCAGDLPSGRPACADCEERERFVRIQPAPLAELSLDRRGLAHPFRLNEKEWELLLSSLHVQSLHRPLLSTLVKGAVEAVFTDEEVRYLGGTLSRVCADAAPGQWVVFALRRTSQAGLTEITSGAWYVADMRVHLRLANYRVTVTLPGLQKLMWENPTRPQGDVFYELVPGKHHVLLSQAHTSPFGSTPPDLAIDYLALTKKAGTVPEALSSEQESPNPSSSRPSLEERLNTLKRLREQGLITDEDYRAKKQQILDTL